MTNVAWPSEIKTIFVFFPHSSNFKFEHAQVQPEKVILILYGAHAKIKITIEYQHKIEASIKVYR